MATMLEDLVSKLKDRVGQKDLGDKFNSIEQKLAEKKKQRESHLASLEQQLQTVNERVADISDDLQTIKQQLGQRKEKSAVRSEKRIRKARKRSRSASKQAKSKNSSSDWCESSDQEIPPRIKNWIEDNLDKGYSIGQLKSTMRQGKEDPRWVDVFLKRSNNRYKG